MKSKSLQIFFNSSLVYHPSKSVLLLTSSKHPTELVTEDHMSWQVSLWHFPLFHITSSAWYIKLLRIFFWNTFHELEISCSDVERRQVQLLKHLVDELPRAESFARREETQFIITHYRENACGTEGGTTFASFRNIINMKTLIAVARKAQHFPEF
jgi:hypothetical protein